MNKTSVNYLAGYPADLVSQIQQLLKANQLGSILLKKYPNTHHVRTDRALYDYVNNLKDQYMRKTGPLSKVAFDSQLQMTANALGTHTRKSQKHGSKHKNKREIHIASLFKTTPPEFLRMIVVHELAHSKESDHNKAFYQLCEHMEPNYHQLEFDLRVYLMYLDSEKIPLWR
ncbi:MAG: M48 family metallopeptidase [Thiotrichales bacterium]|nr:M48 family metallopeptidase [Thiotrichales bacterium]